MKRVRSSRPSAWLALAGALAVWSGCGDTGPLGPSAVALEDTEFAPELGVNLSAMTLVVPGLYALDLVEGFGAEVQEGDSLRVHYWGWLPDGTLFDTSEDRDPSAIHIGVGDHIVGWELGIPGTREGGTRRLVIHSSLAYEHVSLGNIPPYANLIYDVEILEIIRPGAGDDEDEGDDGGSEGDDSDES